MSTAVDGIAGTRPVGTVRVGIGVATLCAEVSVGVEAKDGKDGVAKDAARNVVKSVVRNDASDVIEDVKTSS